MTKRKTAETTVKTPPVAPIIEVIREYLSQYSGFAGQKLNVDFLPPDAASFSVDAVPCKAIVKQYLNGASLRQFDFVIAMRSFWGKDLRQQIDNLGFFEGLAGWIEEQSRQHKLPDLGAGRQPRALEVSSSGYAFAPDTDLARYQMQCKLTYWQK